MRNILNILSLPMLVFFFLKPNSKIKSTGTYSALSILEGKPQNIIPERLLAEYKSWKHVDQNSRGLYFDLKGKIFFFKMLKRHPFSWLFLLKSLIKIREYSYLVYCYHPEAIVVCNEYSFTSSVLTAFCELNNIKHIDVMHGEKVFDINDSYFRYHNCYVWGKEYIALFQSLKASENFFFIELPKALIFDTLCSVNKVYDYTYYLGNENINEIRLVIETLQKLAEKGKK